MSNQVACGQCLSCRKRAVKDKAVRAYHELLLQPLNCSFVTATYDDDHLPGGLGKCSARSWVQSIQTTNVKPVHADGGPYYADVREAHSFKRYMPSGGAEAPVLHHPDVQYNLKRLRKKVGPFRYLMSGEYGEADVGVREWNPHYHFCFFGQSFQRGKRLVKHKKQHLYELWTNPDLEFFWRCQKCKKPMGRIAAGELDFKSAAYTAKYTIKKMTGKQSENYPAVFDWSTGEEYRVPSYCQSSRRPGLGHEHFRRYCRHIYTTDSVVVEGKEFKPPKYYDKLMAALDPERWALICERRKKEHEDRIAADGREEAEIQAVQKAIAKAEQRRYDLLHLV